MKTVAVQLAQSVIAVRVNRNLGYLPDAARAVVDRYKFVEFPTSPHEFFPVDSNQPINFRHGRWELKDRVLVIGWLQIYQTGFAVSVDTNTADSDLVLKDVMGWASSHFNIEFEVVRPTGHLSQLDVRFERRLGELIPQLKPVGAAITKGIGDFFTSRPAYELTGVTFHFDPTANPTWAPSAVKIEPRLGVPFGDRVYFSEAPLSTNDHIIVLERFERTCLESLK